MSTAAFEIAQLSDTHFGTVDPQVRAALLADLHVAPPQLVILTGDVTQRARKWQFREAQAFLEALPAGVPRMAIPGNHDIALMNVLARIFGPYRLFRRHVSPQLEPSFCNETLTLVCSDATRRTRHKHGVLSRAQIERIAARLEGCSSAFTIVATHQPLAAIDPTDLHNLIRGSSMALERWIPAGADLFIGGHIHLPYCVPVATLDGARTSVVLQSGTSLSRRIRGGIPNSYNRIALSGLGTQRRMHLERRDFDRAAGRFGTHTVHEATSIAGGWQLRTVAPGRD